MFVQLRREPRQPPDRPRGNKFGGAGHAAKDRAITERRQRCLDGGRCRL